MTYMHTYKFILCQNCKTNLRHWLLAAAADVDIGNATHVAHYVKTQRHPQVHNILRLLTDKYWATGTLHVYRGFREVCECGFWDMQVDRQTCWCVGAGVVYRWHSWMRRLVSISSTRWRSAPSSHRPCLSSASRRQCACASSTRLLSTTRCLRRPTSRAPAPSPMSSYQPSSPFSRSPR